MARKGLPKTDQVKCAKWLDRGVHPREIAKHLRTTVDVVKKFTLDALNAANAKAKKAEVAATKHADETRKTASALAGAAKTILSQVPTGADDAEPPLLKPAVVIDPPVAGKESLDGDLPESFE